MASSFPKPLNYRVGTTDRILGGPTSAADGFLVLNQASGNVYKAQNGVWTIGGAFDNALLAEWQQIHTR